MFFKIIFNFFEHLQAWINILMSMCQMVFHSYDSALIFIWAIITFKLKPTCLNIINTYTMILSGIFFLISFPPITLFFIYLKTNKNTWIYNQSTTFMYTNQASQSQYHRFRVSILIIQTTYINIKHLHITLIYILWGRKLELLRWVWAPLFNNNAPEEKKTWENAP